MVVRPDMVNGHDLCHGGLIASLADSAFALACNSHGPVTVAAGFSIDFLGAGPARPDAVRRRARGVAARPRGLYDVTVRADDTDEVRRESIAEFRGRSRTIDGSRDSELSNGSLGGLAPRRALAVSRCRTRPSKARVVTVSASASTSLSARSHSVIELTIPKSSRLIRSGSRSARMRAGVGGLAHHLGQPVVDVAPAREGCLLGGGVAAHPQQQGHRGQVLGEHDDAAAHGGAQPLLRRVPTRSACTASSAAVSSSRASSSARSSRCSLLGTWW